MALAAVTPLTCFHAMPVLTVYLLSTAHRPQTTMVCKSPTSHDYHLVREGFSDTNLLELVTVSKKGGREGGGGN